VLQEKVDLLVASQQASAPPPASGVLSPMQVLMKAKAEIVALGERGSMTSHGLDVTIMMARFGKELDFAISQVAEPSCASSSGAQPSDPTMAWMETQEPLTVLTKRKAEEYALDGTPIVLIPDSPRSGESPIIGADGYPVDVEPNNYLMANYDNKRSRLAAEVSVFREDPPGAASM
jgi:hypothetical protein